MPAEICNLSTFIWRGTSSELKEEEKKNRDLSFFFFRVPFQNVND